MSEKAPIVIVTVDSGSGTPLPSAAPLPSARIISAEPSPPPPPNPPPVADFTGTPTVGSIPLTVNFSDFSTNSPTSWEWDFTNSGNIDSTLQNPIYTYTSVGTYSVKLTASNAYGSSSITKTNYISADLPPSDFIGDQSTFPMTLLPGDKIFTTDNVATMPMTLLPGDKIFTTDNVTTMPMTLLPGNNIFTTNSIGIVAGPQLPTANFTYSPNTGNSPVVVTFTDTSDPGTGTITSWFWEFGDGDTSTDQNPVHTYTASGTFTVALTVTTIVGTDTETQPGIITVLAGDPYFANVSLLLHCDGAEGSTTLVDSSQYAVNKEMTVASTITNSISKFGGGSINIPRQEFGVNLDGWAGNNFGRTNLEPYTIECWYYHSFSTYNSTASPLIWWWRDFSYQNLAFLSHYAVGNQISLRCGVNPEVYATINLNQWNHIAVVILNTNDVLLFVNGIYIINTALGSNVTFGRFFIGTGDGQSANGFATCQAYLDEVRVTKGIARYTSNFTPPTAPFPNS